MLNKIRNDMATLFSTNHHLLVNTDLFSMQCKEDSYLKDVWKFDTKSLFSELRNVGVTVFFYGDSPQKCQFIKQNLKLIEQNSHKVFPLKEISESEFTTDGYLVITTEISDQKIVKNSSFSISTSSSPLELKMISNYVSNFDGEYVFKETGNLLLRCRS